MSWEFEKGRVYNRRQDIHGRFGGQQQGGIITPAEHPVVILITGEDCLQHGYADQFRADGVFEYFGEGQVGDMRIRAGNKAIASHSEDGKGLLLFRKTSDGLRFEGEMVCEGFRYQRALDRDGSERNAIVFSLRSLEGVVEVTEARASPTSGATLDELRAFALAAASMSAQTPSLGQRSIYQRSGDVRNFVLARANGVCEGCGSQAPFKRVDGAPYLEPHHLRRLSDGGPDHPDHVIALCPNCHRRVHAGMDGPTYNAELRRRLIGVESDNVQSVRQRGAGVTKFSARLEFATDWTLIHPIGPANAKRTDGQLGFAKPALNGQEVRVGREKLAADLAKLLGAPCTFR